MSAINLNDGRSVSSAVSFPTLSTIQSGKPVSLAVVSAFNAVKDALAGVYHSKDIDRMRKVLGVTNQVLGIFYDLAADAGTMTAESAESFCYDTAGTLEYDQVADAVETMAFLCRLSTCAPKALIQRMYPCVEELREALETARCALRHYLDLSEFVSLSLVKPDKALSWCKSTAETLNAGRVREALQVFEALSRFFDGDTPQQTQARLSVCSPAITKADAVAALSGTVPSMTSNRALALIGDLQFVFECMHGRQEAGCETLLFSHELTESQLMQAVALCEAVADVINANAKEE